MSSSISSAVDSLNESLLCLESTRTKGTDNTAAQQGNTSCPEPTDVSDQLSIAVPPDAKIESCSPVILDPDFSHGVGNMTSNSLTQVHTIETTCLPRNNDGERGQNLPETEGQAHQDGTGVDPVAEGPSWQPFGFSPRSFVVANF